MASQRADEFNFTMFGLWFGFRCSYFEEGMSVSFDGSENPQKGTRSTQIFLYHLLNRIREGDREFQVIES